MIGAALASVLAVSAGCGGGEDDATGPGAAGRAIAGRSGCQSCHGPDYSGGVGPAWTGLFGTTVALSGGGSVIADRAYLVESIRDPHAKIVAGYAGVMPSNSLSDDEIASIVDFIKTLANPDP